MYTLYKMMTRLNLIAVMIATVLAIGVVGVSMTEEVYAQRGGGAGGGAGGGGGGGAKPDAKVRAIQNGNSLDENNPGVLGEDIWCVGGIDNSSEANDIHCYLLSGDTPTPDYKTNHIDAKDGTAADIAPCPPDAGFQPTDICFWLRFPASDFPTAGHYKFVAEFTKDGNIIDLAGTDWRNHSFMVVPELIIGSIGLVGSTLGTLYIYKSKSKSKKSE
jgi:hypothetical protein